MYAHRQRPDCIPTRSLLYWRLPITSLLADGLTITVAPALLNNPLGGLSTHRSSQISVPITMPSSPRRRSFSENGTTVHPQPGGAAQKAAHLPAVVVEVAGAPLALSHVAVVLVQVGAVKLCQRVGVGGKVHRQYCLQTA